MGFFSTTACFSPPAATATPGCGSLDGYHEVRSTRMHEHRILLPVIHPASGLLVTGGRDGGPAENVASIRQFGRGIFPS
jgi:hypothetical protein